MSGRAISSSTNMVNETLDTVTTTYDAWSSLLFTALEPVIIMLVGVMLAHVVENGIRKLFMTFKVDEKTDQFLRPKFSASSVVGSAATFVIYVGSAVLALSRLGILYTTIRVAALVFIAAGVVAGLLRSWDLALNLYASRDVSVRKGDSVRIGCVEGVVEEKRWLNIVVEDGSRSVVVPNRYIRRQL